MAKSKADKIAKTLGKRFFSRKFTTGYSKYANNAAKAKGYRKSLATIIPYKNRMGIKMKSRNLMSGDFTFIVFI